MSPQVDRARAVRSAALFARMHPPPLPCSYSAGTAARSNSECGIRHRMPSSPDVTQGHLLASTDLLRFIPERGGFQVLGPALLHKTLPEPLQAGLCVSALVEAL